MARDYSGFKAIVDAVENLREKVEIENDKQLVVTRAIREDQRVQLPLLRSVAESLRARGMGGNLGLVPDRLQFNNLKLETNSIVLTAKSVVLEAKSGQLNKQETSQDSERLAKTIGQELKNIKVKTDSGLGNPLKLIGAGIFTGIGFQVGGELVRGFEKSFKKNIGLSSRSFGENIGTAVVDPKQAIKDTIKARRDWQVRKESTKQAIELAKSQNVNVDPNKVNIFSVAGMMGRGGKPPRLRKKYVELHYGKENINVIPVSNKNTDPSVSRDKNPLQFTAEASIKLLQNLLIRGYNPDAVKMASQVISAKQKNPEIKIVLEGGSQGGFIVEEVIEILKQAGITDVQGVGIGTPDLGYGFNNKNYKNFFAENEKFNEEPLYKFFGINRKNSNDRLKDYAPLSEPSNHYDYYHDPEVIEAIGVNPQGLNEKIVSHFKSLSMQATAAQNALEPKSKARNSVGNKLFEEIKQAKALLQELKEKNLYKEAEEALSLYNELQESLADVFPQQYLKFKDTSGNAKENYQKIANEVATLSGVSADKLPQLSNEIIDKKGVKAELKNGVVYLSKNIADKLASGDIDADVIETLIHEIRHGVQKYVKKLIDVSALEGKVDERAIPLLEFSANESVNSIEKSLGKPLSTTERSKVYAEEFDAYAFEFVNARKVSKNTKANATQPPPQKLIDRYLVYVDKLVEQAKKQAESRIKTLIPNYANLTIPEKKQFAGQFSGEIGKEIKKFRMAIEDAESQIAVEIGERILTMIQPIRKIYQELLEILPPDLSGTKSIRAQLANLTAIQNEVLKGQPNQKGRAKTGLTQIVGNETAAGFVTGIEAKLNDANVSGEQLAEASIQGAKERLDIASPSKVFKKIGKDSAAGYAEGLEDGETEAKSALDQFWDNLENIPILGWFVKAGRAIANFVGGLFNNKESSQPKKDKKQYPFNSNLRKFVNENINNKQPKQAKKERIEEDSDLQPDKLINRYIVYVDRLIEKAQEEASERVKTLFPNYFNLNIAEKRDFAGEFHAEISQEISQEMDTFREAVQNGQKDLAVEIGEKILADIPAISQIYQDLLEILPPESPGAELIKKQSKKITNFQNEVVKGSNAKGRAKTGLIQIVGSETGEGFIDGIEQKLEKAKISGERLGVEAIKGAKKRLKIASPSKEFETLGKNSGEGFEIGIEKSLDAAKSTITKKVQEILAMDFYHGTSKAGARSILKQGIDVNRVSDAVYGKGFYLTNNPNEAASYAADHRRPAVLKAKLNVKNPFIVTEQGYKNFVKHAEKRGELIEPFSDKNPTAEKYQQYQKDKTKLLQKRGYDSLFIKDRGFAIAFEANQVEFEKAKKNAIQKMIASIKKLFGLGKEAGLATTEGFADGVQGNKSEANAAISDLVDSVIEKAKDDLEIQSPSKVFEEIGKNSAAGYAEGLEDGETEVKSALDQFWDNLENIPILGWFVKAGRAIANFVGGLFNNKKSSQPKQPVSKKTETDSTVTGVNIVESVENNQTNDSNPVQVSDQSNPEIRSPRNLSDVFPDRRANPRTLGRLSLPADSSDLRNSQALLFRGRRNPQMERGVNRSIAQRLDEVAKRVKAEIEIAPGLWVDTAKLNDRSLKRKIATSLVLFWEKFRINMSKEVTRTLMGLLATIPGTVIGRGLTGDALGGYAGGLAGRLIGETGFDDVSNFRSLQKEGLSPATAEFWQRFGDNRKFLPNKLRKAAIGYGTGAIVGKGVGDAIDFVGLNRFLATLLPSWLETAIGDAVNRVVKTIADPNIDLAIPKLPPGVNKLLSAPLHAIGKSSMTQDFISNLGFSFLEGQTKTALMPVREALTAAGENIGGSGLWGEYLGDRFSSLGVSGIQQTAKGAGRGIAGMIAPGMPAQVRDFIADQVVNNTVMDGFIRSEVAPYLAGQAGADIFARSVKVPVTGKIAGTVNKNLDRVDPFPVAISKNLTDEELLLERQKRLQRKAQNTQNVIEAFYGSLDKSINSTTNSVVIVANNFLGFFDNVRASVNQFAKKTAGINLDPTELVNGYIVYLDKIIEDAQELARERIAVLVPDYQSMTIPEKRDFAKDFAKEVNKEVQKFRMAIEDGESQIAVEIGERILQLIQPIRQIYKELLDTLPPDLSGTRSIRAQMGNLTKIQKEVLTGQPNLKGRSPKGLTQVVGEETAAGFISGIERKIDRVMAAGYAMGEAAIEGAKERLGIQSPSKVFERIGAFVVEGFNKGVEKVKQIEFLNNFAQNAEQKLEEAKTVINENLDTVVDNFDNSFSTVDNLLASAVDGVATAVNQLLDNLFTTFPALKTFTDILLAIGAGFLVSQALESLVGWLSGLADTTFDAVLQAESLDLAFASLSGSAEQGAKGLAFVREEAKRLGVDLKTAEEAYAGFTAVTRFTPLQGFQADQIFSSFQETAALRGFSNEEESRIFAAINQMISKRKLSAEEVRGQLGEISGLAFESTLARALGLNAAQMNEQMSEGLLIVEDVLPKIAAQYAAENSTIAAGNDTLAQSLNRLNNAVLTLQRSFASWIEKFKVIFNLAGLVLENIVPIITIFLKALSNAGLTLFLDNLELLARNGLKSNAVLSVFVNFLKAVASLIQYIIPHLITFAAKFALVSLAVDAVSNALSILNNNPFPELTKSIEEATVRAEKLEQAFRSLNETANTVNPNLPTSDADVNTSKNWNLFGFDTGFNLEGTRRFFGLTTKGQSDQAKFQIDIANRLAKTDQTLGKQVESERTLEKIKQLDKELTAIRSRRFQIPAGDRTAYEESVAAEQKLLEQRDKYLKTTAQFQQNLEADKNSIAQAIKMLDGLVARREISVDAEKSLRASLEARLKDVETTSRTFEDLVSSLARQVNALSIALRNLNENATFFNENLERTATNARVEFIRRARASGLGSQVRDAGIEQIESQTLETRLEFLRDQLGAVNEYLSKPDFAALLEELKQQAEDAGINLENTATIDRLIGENRSQQETAVLNALKEQLRLKTEIGQTEENLERSIGQMSSNLRDLNRSVEDFFFNLTQQIEEALVEVDRLLNRLKYSDIKGKLQRALVPGSDTFVNGLVSQIQGIFDQASSIVEQLLGQRSARINFVGERRGLQFELENFTRNLGGATEALELFRQGLLGGQNIPSSDILPVPKPPKTSQGKLPPPPPTMGSKSGNLNNANAFAPLFDLLFKGEGNENSVNRGVAGDTPRGLRSLFGRDAAQFTVGEILNLQKQRRIFAVGMPQFIPSTLREAVKNSGISLDTPFNLQTQQRLAIELFKNKRPEIWQYLTGKSNNLTEAAQGMAREWAAIGLSYPEAGRGVGVSRYAGTAGNAASISPAEVQAALRQTRQNLTQSPTPNIPTADNQRATDLTNTLIGIKNRQINLGDATVRQEIENFILNLNQTRETILRQMGDTIRQSRQSVIDAQNSLIDTRSQYSPQTQTSQLESELRGVENQFRGLDTQLFEQERGLQDNITGLDKLLSEIQPIIELLQSSGNAVDQESAKFLQGLVGQIQGDRTSYTGLLAEIQKMRGELKQGKIDAENFVQAQAKLRKIQSDLERIGTELTIAQQQNNLEQERAIALLQSRQQLEADILQISNDFANEAEQPRRIELAREQARLREREIEYQFQSKTLTQEIELINQRLAIAQNLTNLGITNELQLRQSQKQLEQEILEIKQQYPKLADQELRIQLAKEAASQRERQIENDYRNQRLQREQEILDLDNQIAEARAEQLEASGDVFGAANLREQAAFAAELLRYEQEIEAIRQRYSDPSDQQRADELIRKATILQGLNLERIDRQFKDLGETVRDVATGAFSTFLEDTLTGTKSIGDAFLDMTKSILQSLAQIAARMAISGLFSWLNIGFADGGTVPNFAVGGEIRKNLPILDSIQSALQTEGPQGVLAVFTPGEEILSLRTGEAQRYQSLKAKFGKDPLKQFAGNFAMGGQISDRLLANLGTTPTATMPDPARFVSLSRTTVSAPVANNRTVVVNVTTPDVASFKRSERQIAREVYEYMQRA